MPRGEFVDLVDGILRRRFGDDRADRLLPMIALVRPATPVAAEMEVTVHLNLGS